MKNQGLGSYLQKIGLSLMLPVALLPLAGIMLRFGVYFDNKYVTTAGDLIFSNLPLIFAVAIAGGLAKDNHHSSALSGLIGYLVLTNVMKASDPALDMKVFAGIISGITAATVYNYGLNWKLPPWLNFFSGQRLIPIATYSLSFITSVLLIFIWPLVQSGIASLTAWITGGGSIAYFVYGFLNRMLIPFGLHHIINSEVWFKLGEYGGKTGDLNRFFAGDPTAGVFMTGFFPIMLIGLPAAAAAMIYTAKAENRKLIASGLIITAFTAFLTGITEPIEFLFMFLAPVLYVVHAIFTGLSIAIVNAFEIRNGFTFSAGLVDYLVNMNIAAKPMLLLVVSATFGILYFFTFVFLIQKLNLKTPGREGALDFINNTAQSITDVANFAKKIANGDLRGELDKRVLEQTDEVGDLGKSFTMMKDNLVHIADSMQEASEALQRTASELSSLTVSADENAQEIVKTIEEVARGANDQANDTEKGAEGAHALGQLIEKDQQLLHTLNSESKNVEHVLAHGMELIQQLDSHSAETGTAVQDISVGIRETYNSVNRIKEVSGFIASISDQTNLLALNASIEAAKAGDAGKGFAVVASEIRKLAEASRSSTGEIDLAVKKLTDDAERSVNITEQMVHIIGEQTKSVTAAAGQFKEIQKAVVKIIGIIDEMAKSGQVMTKTKENIVDVLINLSAIAEENAAATDQTVASAISQSEEVKRIAKNGDALLNIANKMEQLAGRFIIK